MAQRNLKVGAIKDVSGEVNIAAGDIIKNIKTIHQRALTAAEEAAHARKLESKLLAQGIATLVQNLSAQASEGTESDSPYKGLLPYSLNEAEIFYGRNKAKKDLLAHIKQSPLTVLHAESGAGKSSLLQAGIAAQLIANGHLAVYLRPYHADPVEFIKRMFLPELSQAPELAGASLREFLRQVCSVLGAKSSLYLLLDQFEEFFQLKKEERQPFLDSLADCLHDPSLNVRWVLALRKEALSDLAELESFGITQFKNTYRLNRLSRAEAQEAITEPAQRYGITFEQALIDHILDTLTTNNEITPTHLQLVCSALTDDLPENKTLTLAYYKDHEGGTEGILRDYLKRQLEHLPAEEQAPAWKVLRALITADRLRAVKTHDEIVEELKLSGMGREQIDTLLTRLVERRLLATQPALIETFELAHDYLVKEIELDPQEQARKAAQELLDQETRTYQRYRTLLTSERLAVIEPYQNELRFSAEAKQLFTESQKIILSGKRRRSTMLIGISVVAIIVAIAMSLLGINAQRQAKIALAHQLAAQSISHLDDRLDLALLLAVEVSRMEDTFEARGSLLAGLESNSRLTAFLDGHNDSVLSVAFSPTGKTLASGGADGNIFLWDVASRQRMGKPLTGHAGSVLSVAFSPDGKILASGSADGNIFLWDVAGRQQMGEPLTGHTDSVLSVAFSPDGLTLASGSADESIFLWDVAGRQRMGKPLTGHAGSVLSVVFSPDGKILASGSADETIFLWDVAGRQQLGEPLTGHNGWVLSLAFSPDGLMLASGSADESIFLWDVAGRQLLGQLAGHTNPVHSVVFSPDGGTLASGSADESIFLWDVAGRQLLGQLAGHTDWVTSVAFSPDGQTLASGSYDATVILWNVASRQRLGEPLLGHTGSVHSVVFSPDGGTLASGGADGNIFLWDVAGRQQLGKLTGHNGWVLSLAFSPDGGTLASGGADGNIFQWDVAGRQRLGKPLAGHAGSVLSVAFSPDGRTLASGSHDGTVILWDVASRQRLGKPLTGHRDSVWGVAFSPDGKILASGGDPRSIILWDVASRQRLGELLIGHAVGTLSRLAFSPDGQTFAAGSFGHILLWDVASRQRLGIIPYPGWARSVAFSPDGKILASGHEDRSIILWDVDPKSWKVRACNIVGRNFTQEEWAQYFGEQGELYHKTCEQWPKDLSYYQAFAQKILSNSEDPRRVQTALDKVRIAMKEDSSIEDPVFESSQIIEESIKRQISNEVNTGNFQQALDLLQQASSLQTIIEDTNVLNDICWTGSLSGFVSQVLEYCEHAVELAPNHAKMRDNRGLARALTGDYSGAIEDFQFFVENDNDENLIQQRQEWINTLKAGRNPFTAEVLKQLRNQ